MYICTHAYIRVQKVHVVMHDFLHMRERDSKTDDKKETISNQVSDLNRYKGFLVVRRRTSLLDFIAR